VVLPQVVTNTYANETYVLYQCGGTRPSANAVPGAKIFAIPLTSVSVPDTVPYAFLVRPLGHTLATSSGRTSGCAL
jgi:hypothetical protein